MRPLEINAERQETQDLILRKEIGNESRFGGQARPDWLNYRCSILGSAQITVELSENCCIGGYASCFAPRFARQPRNGCAIKLPTAVLRRILNEKSIELTQRKLRTSVSIAEAALELKKVIQLSRDWTTEHPLHFGTGSETERRRFNATRTYTEVEEALRWPRMSLTILMLAPPSICLVA